MPDSFVTARAGTNIALVKYWGKRDVALNLPATGSLSLTLAEMGTETRLRFGIDSPSDRITLDGAPAEAKFASRVSRFLDLVRDQAGLRWRAEVHTTNTVPTAAGLASSASGFAALAVAAAEAAKLALSPAALSALARRGSGSAARSIFGGLVEMARGERLDGTDAVAHPLLPPHAWDLRLVVALAATGPKAIGSSEAMEHTARTSPYFPAWVSATEGDLAQARAAIADRDLGRLGPIVERSALRMHASALAADPAIIYWNPATVAAISAVRELRREGTLAFVTIDAGPHVKVLCETKDAAAVATTMNTVPGVLRTVVASAGPGARLVSP